MLLNDLTLPIAYFTSTQDWLIIAGIAVVLFGGKKIPEMARSMGEGIREFKKSINGIDEEPTTGPAKPATPSATTEDKEG